MMIFITASILGGGRMPKRAHGELDNGRSTAGGSAGTGIKTAGGSKKRKSKKAKRKTFQVPPCS